MNFYGTTYSEAFVNNNGNITFNNPSGAYTPFAIGSAGMEIIAAFWGDVDTRGGLGTTTYGSGTVGSNGAFGVTWTDVGYFYYAGDKRNTFQLLLINRPDTGSGNFDIMFNYDSMQWETGDASGGSGGLGGSSARVGFNSGAESLELPGSGVNGALINGGAFSLAGNSFNSAVTGQYIFEVRSGQIQDIPDSVPEPSAFLLLAPGLAGLWFMRRRIQ